VPTDASSQSTRGITSPFCSRRNPLRTNHFRNTRPQSTEPKVTGSSPVGCTSYESGRFDTGRDGSRQLVTIRYRKCQARLGLRLPLLPQALHPLVALLCQLVPIRATERKVV
jgi:hypothetical protein